MPASRPWYGLWPARRPPTSPSTHGPKCALAGDRPPITGQSALWSGGAGADHSGSPRFPPIGERSPHREGLSPAEALSVIDLDLIAARRPFCPAIRSRSARETRGGHGSAAAGQYANRVVHFWHRWVKQRSVAECPCSGKRCDSAAVIPNASPGTIRVRTVV